MTVYVDDMRAKFGRMIMCHMIADSDAELHEMAASIGVARRWFQAAGTARCHYDVCLAKGADAIKRGAVQITARQCAAMVKRREVTGNLGRPEDASQWRADYTAARKRACVDV